MLYSAEARALLLHTAIVARRVVALGGAMGVLGGLGDQGGRYAREHLQGLQLVHHVERFLPMCTPTRAQCSAAGPPTRPQYCSRQEGGLGS